MIKYFEVNMHLYSFQSGTVSIKNFKDLIFVILKKYTYIFRNIHVFWILKCLSNRVLVPLVGNQCSTVSSLKAE